MPTPNTISTQWVCNFLQFVKKSHPILIVAFPSKYKTWLPGNFNLHLKQLTNNFTKWKLELKNLSLLCWSGSKRKKPNKNLRRYNNNKTCCPVFLFITVLILLIKRMYSSKQISSGRLFIHTNGLILLLLSTKFLRVRSLWSCVHYIKVFHTDQHL